MTTDPAASDPEEPVPPAITIDVRRGAPTPEELAALLAVVEEA